MREEKMKQQNKYCMGKGRENRIAQSSLADGNCKSLRFALLIANAKCKAWWVQNFLHTEATICTGSKRTKGSVILNDRDISKL